MEKKYLMINFLANNKYWRDADDLKFEKAKVSQPTYYILILRETDIRHQTLIIGRFCYRATPKKKRRLVEESPKFVCEICNITFILKHNMTRHNKRKHRSS